MVSPVHVTQLGKHQQHALPAPSTRRTLLILACSAVLQAAVIARAAEKRCLHAALNWWEEPEGGAEKAVHAQAVAVWAQPRAMAEGQGSDNSNGSSGESDDESSEGGGEGSNGGEGKGASNGEGKAGAPAGLQGSGAAKGGTAHKVPQGQNPALEPVAKPAFEFKFELNPN